MLSMNSSVSAPVSSRKYSAMVSALSATRRRAPGGSFIWPKTITVLIDNVLAGFADFGFLHFQPESVPSAGAFTDAGEDGIAAVLLGDAAMSS